MASSGNKVTLRSNFPAVTRAMWGAVAEARDKALDAGEDAAESRLERIDNAQGWNLPTEIEQEKTGFQSGRIYYNFFYGRWFEYGTARWGAQPFMRPAHRKMRSVFIAALGVEAPKWIRRKAAIR